MNRFKPRPWRRRAGWSGALVLAAAMLTVSPAFAQADEARARKIVSGTCFLCHGANGESATELFPRLAGQHWEYTAKQLANFKSGKRKSTAMADMASKLTPDEMVALGKYFEQMPTVKEAATDAELAAVGSYIYSRGNRFSGVPPCASCHGPDAQGTAMLPRLAGQVALYTERQLKQFGTRERNNDNAVMHAIVSKMTALEMAAVAQYLSTR